MTIGNNLGAQIGNSCRKSEFQTCVNWCTDK